MSDNNEETTAVEQTASETSAQVAQGATDYGYVSSGNDSGNVRLIKNYALFLFPQGDSTFVAPDGVNWTPSNKKPIGYSTEDGAVLHPEPGDSTDYKAHNGDIVLSDTDPGYWTLQLAAMEGRKDVVSAYFDVDVESDGGISIKGLTPKPRLGNPAPRIAETNGSSSWSRSTSRTAHSSCTAPTRRCPTATT